MWEPQIDYAAVFRALPGMVALLTPDLVYADANDDFVRLAGRTREQLLGRYIFDVFPENPNDPAAAGMSDVQASMLRVVAGGERDTMALQRYDIEDPQRPGHWQERYWSPVNAPVLGPDGQVVLILHRVEDVTELIRARGGPGGDSRARVLEAELYTRARELQEVNQRLRKAHAREREVALALQAAMLPAPRPLGHHRAAVRYRPAIGALNVCGDWYDLVDLPGENLAVAVGDVVGHGLAAACTMGQLRSALSAATRVADGPAEALEALGLYARYVDGAEATTVVTTFIDWDSNTITYCRPPSCIPTAPSPSSTRRPTPRSPPAPNTSPVPRPTRPSPRAPPWSCTPTVSSSAARRTSTSAWPASPTPSPTTGKPTPRPSPTPC